MMLILEQGNDSDNVIENSNQEGDKSGNTGNGDNENCDDNDK